MAGIHHDDAVGHRHRLDLIVRHVDRRRREPLVQRLDLGAHRHPQLGVEVGQRLVEQKDLRLANDCAAHRDALALTARQLAGIALQVVHQAEDLRRVVDTLIHRARRFIGQAQAERHVVEHRHVRVQRVVLEHHRDVALFRREAVNDPRADPDLAVADLLEPSDHAQQRGLAAARRADQHAELTVGHRHVDRVHDLGLAEALANLSQHHVGHGVRAT